MTDGLRMSLTEQAMPWSERGAILRARVLALLGDGQRWCARDLAVSLGVESSPRTPGRTDVQRTLVALRVAGLVDEGRRVAESGRVENTYWLRVRNDDDDVAADRWAGLTHARRCSLAAALRDDLSLLRDGWREGDGNGVDQHMADLATLIALLEAP